MTTTTKAEVQAAFDLAAKAAGFSYKDIGITIDGNFVEIHVDKLPVRIGSNITPERDVHAISQLALTRFKEARAYQEKHGTESKVKIPALMRVKSSSIAEIGYADEQLFVRFAAGRLYRYPGVSAEQFNAVRIAKSVGKALQLEVLAKHTGKVVPEPDGA